MQKVRGCAYVYIASTDCRQMVSVLFHSPPGVLFTFPSRYLFTIGHQGVFSLTRWSGQIPTEFHVLHGTRVYKLLFHQIFVYKAVTFFGCPFQNNSTNKHDTTQELYFLNIYIPQPLYHNAHRLSHDIDLGSSPFAHHY